jgi:hypothetical protein
MLRTYEIVLGEDSVAIRRAPTAQMALVEHLRMAGCSDADIVRLGAASVAWRGAVYRALFRRDQTDADARSEPSWE